MSEVLPERLLNPQALADILGLPVRTLYAWRQSGKGPKAIVVGRHLRWEPAEVRRWLDEQSRWLDEQKGNVERQRAKR